MTTTTPLYRRIRRAADRLASTVLKTKVEIALLLDDVRRADPLLRDPEAGRVYTRLRDCEDNLTGTLTLLRNISENR